MMINFLKGQPSEDILPTQLFAKAAQKAFSRPNAAVDVLQYGEPYGHPDFLENLAVFLTQEYKSPVSSRHLCATPGASLSLEHLLAILTRPQTTTKHVFFQDPTYFLAFDIFLDTGFTRDQFIGIPEEAGTGLNVDVLEEHLTRLYGNHSSSANDGRLVFESVLYCVPTHANPTGSILSDEKRKRLVQLGRRFNMLIVCDDVYDILTFEGEIPKRLVAYDLEDKEQYKKHVVISNGSFSKLLAPGARAGWIEAGEDIIKAVGGSGSFVSGSSPCYLSCGLINEMLIDGSLHNHVEFLKQVHTDRLYNGLWTPILEHLVPLGCSVSIRPTGGYFVWMKIPVTATQLTETIKKHNIEVGIGSGTLFVVSIDPSTADYYVRLCFAHYDTYSLQLGIARLKQALILTLNHHSSAVDLLASRLLRVNKIKLMICIVIIALYYHTSMTILNSKEQ